MSKPFDATLKAMFEVCPSDWARLLDLETRFVEVIDADVSTVTAATDKVLRLRGERDALLQFDFQAGPDASLPRRMHCYNALLEERHALPVMSVAVLLRPEAQLRSMTGLYERQFPGDSEPYLSFQYKVIRVWELSAERLLAGGPGTLPLAPIGAVSEAELPGVVQRMQEKLEMPRFRKMAGQLWTAVDVLLGLRYDQAMIQQLLRGVRGMKESVTYQAIVEEGVVKGRLEEARRILLRQGEQLFGKPAGARARGQMKSINSVEVLEELVGRVLRVATWEELLEDVILPAPRGGRKKKSQ